jgi:putative tryptophan/tyrosine transport system substrate-binding protein
MIRRREFITLLGGAAASWPLTAHAQQQVAHMRLIGWLDSYDESDTGPQSIRSALREGLAKLGGPKVAL